MKRLCKKKICTIHVDYETLKPDTYRGVYALEGKKKIYSVNTGNFNKDVWTVYNEIIKMGYDFKYDKSIDNYVVDCIYTFQSD